MFFSFLTVLMVSCLLILSLAVMKNKHFMVFMFTLDLLIVMSVMGSMTYLVSSESEGSLLGMVTFAVCESSLGITLLVNSVRSKGTEYYVFKNLSSF